MQEKGNEKSYMLILRYGYIVFFIMSYAISIEKVDSHIIILLLFYLINNQLRYFILPKNKNYMIPSLVIETLLSFIMYKAAGDFGVVIFIPTLIDVIYYFSFFYTLGVTIVITIFMLIQGQINNIIAWGLATVPMLLLLTEIKDEKVRKNRAQELYDILREKDEDLKRANKELETYANTVEEIAVLRERNRISREIHDNVGHALSTIIIQLGAIEKIAPKNGEQAAKMADNLTQFAKESMERVRSDVRAMKPREFEEYEGIISVSEMIKNFQKLTGIEVSLRISDKVWKLNSDQTMVLYKIIQEFLSNSVRHGKATKVKIFLNFLDTHLRAHLKDNGIGCANVKTGVGLKSIQERVAVWGGEVEYFTKEGEGFELVVSMEKVKLSMDGM